MVKAFEDLLIYLVEHWREISLQGVLTALAVIMAKRIGIKQLKRLLHLREDTDEISAKLDAIINHLGVTTSATSITSEPCHNRLRMPYILPWAASTIARHASRSTTFITRRQKRMKRKLASRKLWAMISVLVTSLLVLFKFDTETATQVTAVIANVGVVVTYILVEGATDKAAASAAAAETEVIEDANPPIQSEQ